MERHFDVHGVTVVVDSPDLGVHQLVGSRLRAFGSPSDQPGKRDSGLRFTFERGDVGPPDAMPHDAWPVYSLPDARILYSPSDDRLKISHRKVWVEGSPSVGQFRVVLSDDSFSTKWLATHGFLTVPLIEGLRWRGRFSVHAGAVAQSDSVLLLAGPSGAGKSTLAVALAYAGWDFLADDTVFLDGADTGRVLGFPDEVDLTDSTLDFWPQLKRYATRPVESGSAKHQLAEVDEALQTRVVRRGQASWIVLVDRRGRRGGRPAVKPVGSSEAAASLVAAVAQTNPAVTAAHASAVEEFAMSCRVGRLTGSADPMAAAKVIQAWLAETATARGISNAS